jgi:hypothetical protein
MWRSQTLDEGFHKSARLNNASTAACDDAAGMKSHSQPVVDMQSGNPFELRFVVADQLDVKGHRVCSDQ